METEKTLLNLPFDTGTDFIVYVEGVDSRLRSTLVGIKPGEYLIIEMPRITGIETKIYEGNKVTVIFLHSGVVYAFKVSILNSIRNPARLIFLSYPEEMEKQELREAKRVQCYIPATARLENAEAEYAGVILDISPGGCQYSSNAVTGRNAELLRPGAKIDLSFQVLGVQGTQTFRCEIQNVKHEQHRIMLGIKFLGLEPSICEKIVRYIDSVTSYLAV